MNTSAYLSSQGWLGAGHSLHPSGRGIKKPLLVSQKKDALGIGKRKHDALADQWWARAFDDSLKGLNMGRHEVTGEVNTVTGSTWGALDMLNAGGTKWAAAGGLYAGFVRGPGLVGTISSGNHTLSDTTDKQGEFMASRAREICLRSKEAEKGKRTHSKSITKHEKHQQKQKKRRRKVSNNVDIATSDPHLRSQGVVSEVNTTSHDIKSTAEESTPATVFQERSQPKEAREEPFAERLSKKKCRKHRMCDDPGH